MNPLSLPILAAPSNTDKDYLGQFAYLAGKRVLCIGYSEEEADNLVAKYQPESIHMLTNWAEHGDAKVHKYPLVIGDITKRTHFPDNAFDAVLTFSVLEHLPDLDGAAKEMTRIVKKGGEILHFFGPAWSCAYGHHCYARPGDRLMDFTQWKMPAHMHLLCEPEEIRAYYLGQGYAEKDVAELFVWFYETPIINRLFYDTYNNHFAAYFQIDQMELMYNDLPKEHLDLLRLKYQGVLDFSTYGGKYKLKVMK